MRYHQSALYNSSIPNLKLRLRKSFIEGLNQREQSSVTIFFRADDVAVPSSQFLAMVNMFIQYKTPLCLAVVPSWLSSTRLKILQKLTGKSSQFCWHQHGWLHKNYEQSGKKQEFGPSRSKKQLKNDLIKGKTRLQTLLGDDFSSFFTPPWNRCSSSTLTLLQELHFKGVSRSKGASPVSSVHLPDLQVNVDLHTRKESESKQSLQSLLQEITVAISTGNIGVMLHHQRMNDNALHFLDVFLQVLLEFKELRSVHFNEMS